MLNAYFSGVLGGTVVKQNGPCLSGNLLLFYLRMILPYVFILLKAYNHMSWSEKHSISTLNRMSYWVGRLALILVHMLGFDALNLVLVLSNNLVN